MQFYAIKNRLPLKTVLFLALVLFVAYLPISSFLFFLKNDAFTGYFPPKFFMSESLHAGHLPLWNPYINFGIPQYGDMSSGYWSPITWLIAGTVGYNAYTFTLEVLLYILIGGLGMYKLTAFLKLHKPVCQLAAVAYLCCGYNIGHLQHFNWLSGAAFLPWCFWAYQQMLQHASLKSISKAVFVFYLLAASAHPGITISAAYFFCAFLLAKLLRKQSQESIGDRLMRTLKSHALFLGLFGLVAAGMIIGYLDILPHFGRGEKISIEDSLLHPSTPQSWISLLLPFATVKNDAFFNTDISMRNSYFSCTLLLFFLSGLLAKKSRLQIFLLASGAFFMLLSFGGIFKTAAYQALPFIGYIRLNGEFSIFAIFCFLLFAAIELNKLVTEKQRFGGRIRQVYYAVEIATIMLIIVGLYKTFTGKESVLFHLGNLSSQAGVAGKLKYGIDALTFYDCLWIQGLIQLLLLWGIKWCLKQHNLRLLVKIVVLDMVLASLLNIPFTGAGKASVAVIQTILNKSPKGIPVPDMVPLYLRDTIPANEKAMIGDWSFYSKQPGTMQQALYPIVLKNTVVYFDSMAFHPSLSVSNRPLLFTTENAVSNLRNGETKPIEWKSDKLRISGFSPNSIVVDIDAAKDANLVYLQNYYPHWFYSNGSNKLPVQQAGINFMHAPFLKGSQQITFSFEPKTVRIGMIVSIISLLGLCIILLIPGKTKSSSPS